MLSRTTILHRSSVLKYGTLAAILIALLTLSAQAAAAPVDAPDHGWLAAQATLTPTRQVLTITGTPPVAFDTNLFDWYLANEAGEWTLVADGLQGTAPSGGDSWLLSTIPVTLFDYTVRTEITGGSRLASAGVMFRSAEDPLQGSYMVRISIANGGEIAMVRFYPVKRYRQIARRNLPIRIGKEYTIRVVGVGNEFSIYLDGRLMMTARDSNYSEGVLGLNVFGGTAVFRQAFSPREAERGE